MSHSPRCHYAINLILPLVSWSAAEFRNSFCLALRRSSIVPGRIALVLDLPRTKITKCMFCNFRSSPPPSPADGQATRKGCCPVAYRYLTILSTGGQKPAFRLTQLQLVLCYVNKSPPDLDQTDHQSSPHFQGELSLCPGTRFMMKSVN